MIDEALLHCAGIGPARLAQLHELGIRTWSDAMRREARLPAAVRAGLLEECQRCLTALQDQNIGYFVETFAAQDKAKILRQFYEQTSFFDIETTGLDFDARITVIACWHRGQMHTFVEHENLDEFLDLLDDVALLASFNGSSFDVPRVLDAFHIPELPCPHLDLRWSCYHQGMRGTLKRIAERVGIHRPVDLQDADGALAVHLWNRWTLAQDDEARHQLLRYCAADVLLLAMLAAKLAGRHEDYEAWWSHLPGAPAAAPQPTAITRLPAISGHFGGASPSRLRARRIRVAG